ncbi:hypothetical protein B4U80_15092, partial [Leptotrombidium deliense]
MSFSILPEELVIRIFSCLNVVHRFQIRRVCKQWARLSFIGIQRIIFVNKDLEDDYFRDLCKFDDGVAVESWNEILHLIGLFDSL